MKVPPIERTSSAEAGRTSYALTLAPSRLAVAIACSPATPAPEHHHRRGRDRAGGGHEQGQEARQPDRGLDDAPVPGDQRLGGEGVHRLGAGDPRHQLEGERGDLRGGERLHGGELGRRRAQADGDRAGPQPLRQPRVQRPHVQQHVDGAGVDGLDHLGAGLGVGGVGDRAVHPRPGLHGDLEPGVDHLPGGLGGDGDPALARDGLGGDGDLHARQPSGAEGLHRGT